MRDTPGGPSRLYGLDALRGVAALVVVVFHWFNFQYLGSAVRYASPPFEEPLRLIYARGYLAVDAFFALSGFVFFWRYADAVAERSATLKKFISLRFSRLYPLHAATLVLVAAGQIVYPRLAGRTFAYERNDAWHFVANALLVQNWAEDGRMTFNGPAWSLSVEVLLYAMFFALCRLRRPGWVTMAALVGLGMFVASRHHEMIGRGVTSFFAGGLAHAAYARIGPTRHARPIGSALVTVALLVFVAHAFFHSSYPTWADHVAQRFPIQAASVAMILGVALRERAGSARRTRSLEFLGDISYSSYLLHFPLQLIVACGVKLFDVPPRLMFSPWALLIFFAVLLPLAWLCHHRFEMPAQRWLRARLLPRRPDDARGPA